ncbi:MAG: hypothetical protein COV65_01295 [Nitrosopumilales archaeon CG11_big_fil_rev_8_21_14_0_20_33_24]|nr:MAG: hypothetical protein COV65_01295 [Nitrosopumilales archaeon CG11_big_fil_rev_8_21_14_0_20_33_24]
MDKSQIEKFRCDDEARYDLFSHTPAQNMAKDSLKILDGNDIAYTYDNGKLFDSNNREVSKVKDKFLKLALKTLSRLSSIPETRQLVEELQFSPNPFFIKLGGNRYSPNAAGERMNTHGNNAGFISMLDELKPMVDGLPFDRIGFGGFIYWNPQTKASFVEEDNVERQVDTDLILAHEMYHAYDGMRGLLDRRFVQSEGEEKLEFQPICEYRAVRMENITRKALGYKYRRYYGGQAGDAQDMLDEHNEPEVMPTPCINWL